MIREACITLARMIPDDGEGATHLITIDVEGARSLDDARTIAKAIADSPLVKTAIHGADPNWGRIVSAAGYAGVAFEEADLSLWLNGIPLYREGAPLPFDDAEVSNHLKTGAPRYPHPPRPRPRIGRRPVLDVRPHRRVRPAQRRLHDLSPGADRVTPGRPGPHWHRNCLIFKRRPRLPTCRSRPTAASGPSGGGYDARLERIGTVVGPAGDVHLSPARAPLLAAAGGSWLFYENAQPRAGAGVYYVCAGLIAMGGALIAIGLGIGRMDPEVAIGRGRGIDDEAPPDRSGVGLACGGSQRSEDGKHRVEVGQPGGRSGRRSR